MFIEKGMSQEGRYKIKRFYYDSARAAMFQLVQSMFHAQMIDTILMPGYIGWSPKEGSGLFDPIYSIKGLCRKYYRMSDDLTIDQDDLMTKAVSEKTIVLLVNYFGFRDPGMHVIIKRLKEKSVWTLEDNAHGLFTYFKYGRSGADATFFSLHKMLPFETGGEMLILNTELQKLKLSSSNAQDYNVEDYDFGEIARQRTYNYLKLDEMVRTLKYQELFIPLKEKAAIKNAVPQTYPILIKTGSRDRIYELMNEAGYGVVSLYHTMIPELRNEEFSSSVKLSQCILNLPVHQDTDSAYYEEMLDCLAGCCRKTME